MIKKESSQKNKVALLTGATSVLGKSIAHQLINRGYVVKALIRDDPKSIQLISQLPVGVIPYTVDITIPSQEHKKELLKACSGVDRVFHIAAAVYKANNTFDSLMKTNVVGTENLITSLIEANPDKHDIHILFASTMSVYGHNKRNQTLTELSKPTPDTAYGKSKFIAEQLIESYCDVHKNLHYTIIRMGTLYGNGYEKPSFCKVFGMIKKGSMRYLGDKNNTLTLIHVDDAVNAYMLAIEKEQQSYNNIYNITDGVAHTQEELFSLAAAKMHVAPPTKTLSGFVAKIFGGSKISQDELDFLLSSRVVSIKKASSELSFVPIRKITKEGIDMIENCDFKG